MIIKEEDNAASYAKGLADCLSRDITNDENCKDFGGNFNRKRIPLDSIFNYKDKDVFVNEVLSIFKAKYPKLFKKYSFIIKDLASSYANEKMKVSKIVTASVSTEFKYFNY